MKFTFLGTFDKEINNPGSHKGLQKLKYKGCQIIAKLQFFKVEIIKIDL